MSNSIETRIERLEQHAEAMAAASESTLLVTFQGSSEPDPLNLLRAGGRDWERGEAESEEAFLQRAIEGAAAPARGCIKVLFAGRAPIQLVAA